MSGIEWRGETYEGVEVRITLWRRGEEGLEKKPIARVMATEKRHVELAERIVKRLKEEL